MIAVCGRNGGMSIWQNVKVDAQSWGMVRSEPEENQRHPLRPSTGRMRPPARGAPRVGAIGRRGALGMSEIAVPFHEELTEEKKCELLAWLRQQEAKKAPA